MAEFFPNRGGDGYGLALFLNAGDPPLPVLADLVQMLDESGVDCLELAVPFPNSVTDGPTIRRSADRALAQGVGLAEVLAFVARVRPTLRRLRIALLADWAYSIRGRSLASATGEILESGVDGLLLHALPPKLRAEYHEVTAEAGLPIVTTCYHGKSSPQVLATAAANASAYLYLVAHYGKSGTTAATDHPALAATITGLRAHTSAPIAVGFGVRDRRGAQAVAACGADAVIIGSAGVARVESALADDRDVVDEFRNFVRSIGAPDEEISTITTGG
ncbi:tryptophan synthase subunit alpha [Actinophytocola xinjiangensis]|uniref:tryptophan synthase n=1 Tax=Actinophytocola xinjiangensis TaxID=485602 RepID=A0A7Z0WHI0_9PSEU|nr:tryptophan synthase subunit alpha [Actinophytocola xinjiangensis]OLF06630.1 tryptophan synthase subunit alpha [Actinophytocola xinjiangensis]